MGIEPDLRNGRTRFAGKRDNQCVEDIVAIRVKLEAGPDRFFLTYGRIFGAVDATGTLQVVARNLHAFALGGQPVRVELCHTLQEAKDQPYFFEAIAEFAQQPIPYGAKYEVWRRRIAREMVNGKHLYYLGRKGRYGSRPGLAVAGK
jgi:hypothetical protein